MKKIIAFIKFIFAKNSGIAEGLVSFEGQGRNQYGR